LSEIIKLENVTFSYIGSSETVLLNVNLSIEEGMVTAIIGPTGAGKSTLLKMLNGIVPKVTGGRLEGKVIVDGLDTRTHSISELARHVGIVLDDPSVQIFTLLVEDEVAFGPCNLGLPRDEVIRRVNFALESVGLTEFRRRNPSELSGGEQQLLAIAGALAMKPRILVLDEPLSMLDPIGKQQVIQVLKNLANRRESTIILTESGADISMISDIIDRAVILHDGMVIADGDPKTILSSDIPTQIGVRRPQTIEVSLQLRKYYQNFPICLSVGELANNLRKIIRHPGENAHLRRIVESVGGESIISVENLHFIYPGGVHALKGVSLNIPEKVLVGLIGQNGSGKTTLALNLVGLLKPTNNNAKIIVDGVDIIRSDIREVIKHINYVFQNQDHQIFNDTVEEEIAYGVRNLGLQEAEIMKRVNEAIEFFELEAYRKAYPLTLPKHLRKRVAIASIYALKPKILIIDEPTTGLDTLETRKLMDKILEYIRKGNTVIIITHDIETIAEYADHLIVMSNGKILLTGRPEEVFSEHSLLREADILPPQVTQVSHELNLGSTIISISQMIDFIGKSREGVKGHGLS